MISINYRDPAPIYEQVKSGFRKLILSGVLALGDKMPSVRSLAMELAINPNTVQRAYNELESEGFIYSVPGRGSFVSDIPKISEEKMRELKERLIDTAKNLMYMGVTKEEIIALIGQEETK